MGRSALWGTTLATVCALLISLLLLDAQGRTKLSSCCNHGSQLTRCLVDTVSRRGWLPYERGGVAEETLWGADVPMPGAYNCNEAAPGQLVGGWQYLHASPETWRLLLKTFDRRKIPVAWCGRVHSFSLGKPLTRVSVMLHVDAKSISILETYLHSLREGQPMAAHSNSLYLYTDVMPDEELSTALAEVNAILVEQKETKARADTEGRADYSKYLRSP